MSGFIEHFINLDIVKHSQDVLHLITEGVHTCICFLQKSREIRLTEHNFISLRSPRESTLQNTFRTWKQGCTRTLCADETMDGSAFAVRQSMMCWWLWCRRGNGQAYCSSMTWLFESSFFPSLSLQNSPHVFIASAVHTAALLLSSILCSSAMLCHCQC